MRFILTLVLVWNLACANQRIEVLGTIYETSTKTIRPVVTGAKVQLQIDGDTRFTETVSDNQGAYRLEVIIDKNIEALYPELTQGENADLSLLPAKLYVTKTGYKKVVFPLNVQVRFSTTQDIALEPESAL